MGHTRKSHTHAQNTDNTKHLNTHKTQHHFRCDKLEMMMFKIMSIAVLAGGAYEAMCPETLAPWDWDFISSYFDSKRGLDFRSPAVANEKLEHIKYYQSDPDAEYTTLGWALKQSERRK